MSAMQILEVGLATTERARLEHEYRTFLQEAFYLGPWVTYVPNRWLPLLRLYRFKEAFSLNFVDYWLDRFQATGEHIVLDPFAGMGTTLFGSMLRGIPSIGIEKLPIAAFVAETLPKFLLLQPGQIRETFRQIKPLLDRIPPAPVASDVNLVRVGFDEEILLRLQQWKAAIETASEPVRDALMLLFYSALYDCSYGSNDGQFTRIRRDKKVLWPDDAILRKVEAAEEDLLHLPLVFSPTKGVPVTVLREDARKLESLPIQVNFVITSPPYLNRYDYTRSYCFELCFGFVRNFQELRNLRHSLLRSHIESRVDGHECPSSPAIREVLDCLAHKNLNNSKIPDMIRGYFADMAAVIRGLPRVLAPRGQVAMVVDNVRFEGEMIPVDLILCHIAEEMGLQVEAILICRLKGNSSQQMARYGRLPVRESVVVWRKV